MFSFWYNLVFVYLLADYSQQYDDFRQDGLVYRKEGNMSLIGIFNDRFGPNCSLETGRGLEEIASMIWTIETLNRQQYIPGLTIGLSVFGVCQDPNNWNGFIETVEEHVRFNEGDNYFGVLTSSEIRDRLPEKFSKGNIRHVEHILNADILTEAMIQLLINLQWMRVKSVVSDSANILKSFKEKASEEGLFVQDELLMNNGNSCASSHSKTSSVIVAAGAFDNISNLSENICEENITVILTPTDFLFDVSLLDSQLKNALVSLPPIGEKAVLSGYITQAQRREDFFSQKPPTKGPLFIGVASSVLKLLKPIKTAFDCQNKHSEQPCADFIDEVLGSKASLLPQTSMKISPDDVEETLKVLKIEPSPNDEMFLYITSVINANATEDVAIFQIFNFATKTFQPILIMINDDLLTNAEITSNPNEKIEKLGQDYQANLEENQTDSHLRDPVINAMQKFLGNSAESFNYQNEQIENASSKPIVPKVCDLQNGQPCLSSNAAVKVSWRFLTWVSINTSLGFVGITCTLSAMLFIIVRLCKDDILEGSPCFTLLLMVSVVLTYLSSFPFHVEFSHDNDFICSYRKTVPPTVFTILFSLLLSRSLVLAFRENGGEFVTHVNGYLQSILCFFMIGVQVSVIYQNWIISKDEENCADVYDGYKIIFALGYDFLLLILLACVSPFIVRLKENYKEGLLFSISVFFITVVWSAWVSFYVLLPKEHRDAAIAIGLNSTASVLLFCIFIPQTYFMAAPFVQNRTLRSLSPLNESILRDVNFKSNQALNETAFGSITYKTCEMGVSNPNFLTSRSSASNNPISGETIIDVSPETSQPQ